MADVLLHPDVDDWLDDQPDHLTERIRSKLADAGEDPEHYLTPLAGRDTYRLRIGDYRAEIDWDQLDATLRVLQIGHRDGFYD
ncbi:MAG: type II toxin-antitoxin system RelE/ParE family toxin [Halodesulfurarchaeum sp.]